MAEPRVMKMWDEKDPITVFDGMDRGQLGFYLESFKAALIEDATKPLAWLDAIPSNKLARTHYELYFKERPETSLARAAQSASQIHKSAGALNRALRHGDRTALKQLTGPSGAELRAAYQERFLQSPEETYLLAHREFDTTDLERKLRRAAGDEVAGSGFGELSTICANKVTRERFFGQLHDLRRRYPEVVVRYLDDNLALKGEFRQYLKDVGAKSNPEGHSTSKTFEGDARLTARQSDSLDMDRQVLKARLGWDLATVSQRSGVAPQDLLVGIKDRTFKLGRTQLTKVMNAVLDHLTSDEIAHMVRAHGGATYVKFVAALRRHVWVERPDREKKLRKIP